MAKEDKAGKPPALRLDRHYDAAPEEVWRAWTEPKEMKRWWGPGKNDVVHLAESMFASADAFASSSRPTATKCSR